MKAKANRYFYRVNGQGHPIPGTLVRLVDQPVIGRWREVPSDPCCDPLEGCLPCSLEERTYTSDIEMDLGQDYAIQITLNGFSIVSAVGPHSQPLNDANAILEGLGVLTMNPNNTVTLVTNICAEFGLFATND